MIMGLKETAAALGVSKHFLRIGAKAGRIPHFRSGVRYMFDVEQVETYLKLKALENIAPDEPDERSGYGKLRLIDA